MNSRGPLGRFLLGLLLVTSFFLLLWGGVSLFHLAVLCKVPEYWAWIPPVSTSGVMLLSTAIAMQDKLEQKIRNWAWGLAGFGIFADIAAAGGQHVMEMTNGATYTPDPMWGMAIGGLPPLMGGVLVHVISMVFSQHRREQAEIEAAQGKLDDAQRLVAATQAELSKATRLRDSALAEDARVRQAARRSDEEAATRSRQTVQRDCDRAATLRDELASTREEIEAENQAIDLARREQERLRSRQRRQRDKPTPEATASQPLSQPVSHDAATASQPTARRSKPADRRQWAYELLQQGADIRPADIDAQFPDGPRDGARILGQAREMLKARMDGELSVITSGGA